MIFLKPDQYLPNIRQTEMQLRQDLTNILPDLDFEPIGSTSIPGALSKGDLDVLVRVEQREMEDTIAHLCAHGWSIKEGTLRTPTLCMLISTKYEGDVAVQLIVRNSEWECFTQFKEILKRNPPILQKYNELKEQCAGFNPEEYRRIKSQFIEKILNEN